MKEEIFHQSSYFLKASFFVSLGPNCNIKDVDIGMVTFLI